MRRVVDESRGSNCTIMPTLPSSFIQLARMSYRASGPGGPTYLEGGERKIRCVSCVARGSCEVEEGLWGWDGGWRQG